MSLPAALGSSDERRAGRSSAPITASAAAVSRWPASPSIASRRLCFARKSANRIRIRMIDTSRFELVKP